MMSYTIKLIIKLQTHNCSHNTGTHLRCFFLYVEHTIKVHRCVCVCVHMCTSVYMYWFPWFSFPPSSVAPSAIHVWIHGCPDHLCFKGDKQLRQVQRQSDQSCWGEEEEECVCVSGWGGDQVSFWKTRVWHRPCHEDVVIASIQHPAEATKSPWRYTWSYRICQIIRHDTALYEVVVSKRCEVPVVMW